MIRFDPRLLRHAFGRYPTGVTVVTARTDTGHPVGFTANSFTSVSMDPPLLLVCPGRHLSSFAVFDAARHFAVSVLAHGQEHVSTLFARATGDRFAQTDWDHYANGCALISGRVAGFSCDVVSRVDAGDHLVLIGQVSGFDHTEAPALGFAAGAYFNPAAAMAAGQSI